MDALLHATGSAGLKPPALFPLPPIPRDAYRDIIETPLAVANAAGMKLDIDPLLVDALVVKSTGADALPLLAFTLRQLIADNRAGAVAKLTLENFEAAGGMVGVLAARLAAAQRAGGGGLEALRRLFLPHLCTWDADATPPGAKRLTAREADLTSGPRGDLAPLVEALVTERLLTRSGDETGAVTLEVAHEALLRQPPLSDWLEADREFLIWREGVARARSGFEANSRGLLMGRELEIAREWLSARPDVEDISKLDRRFIEISIVEEHKRRAEDIRRQRYRQRFLTGAAFAFAGLAIVLGIMVVRIRSAYEQTQSALIHARIAEENAVSAKSRADAARELAEKTSRQLAQSQEAERGLLVQTDNEKKRAEALLQLSAQQSTELISQVARDLRSRGDLAPATIRQFLTKATTYVNQLSKVGRGQWDVKLAEAAAIAELSATSAAAGELDNASTLISNAQSRFLALRAERPSDTRLTERLASVELVKYEIATADGKVDTAIESLQNALQILSSEENLSAEGLRIRSLVFTSLGHTSMGNSDIALRFLTAAARDYLDFQAQTTTPVYPRRFADILKGLSEAALGIDQREAASQLVTHALFLERAALLFSAEKAGIQESIKLLDNIQDRIHNNKNASLKPNESPNTGNVEMRLEVLSRSIAQRNVPLDEIIVQLKSNEHDLTIRIGEELRQLNCYMDIANAPWSDELRDAAKSYLVGLNIIQAEMLAAAPSAQLYQIIIATRVPCIDAKKIMESFETDDPAHAHNEAVPSSPRRVPSRRERPTSNSRPARTPGYGNERSSVIGAGGGVGF